MSLAFLPLARPSNHAPALAPGALLVPGFMDSPVVERRERPPGYDSVPLDRGRGVDTGNFNLPAGAVADVAFSSGDLRGPAISAGPAAPGDGGDGPAGGAGIGGVLLPLPGGSLPQSRPPERTRERGVRS